MSLCLLIILWIDILIFFLCKINHISILHILNKVCFKVYFKLQFGAVVSFVHQKTKRRFGA